MKHPLQSFVWDDFVAQPGRRYQYVFTPLQGTPGHLKAIPGRQPISIKVRTESLFSKETHDVFFNRGVASSQAYASKFGNKKPDELPASKRADAFAWLSRKLDTGILTFIKQAKKGDTLLCCFYEFSYLPVASALQTARAKNGVNVRSSSMASRTERRAEAVPRDENEQTKADAHLPDSAVAWRRQPGWHRAQQIHGPAQRKKASEVDGFHNISVGDSARRTSATDPIRRSRPRARLNCSPRIGAKQGDDRATSTKAKSDYRAKVEAIAKAPTKIADIGKARACSASSAAWQSSRTTTAD